MPDPATSQNNIYAMGGQIPMVIDATPKEGILSKVSMFANGRFIGEAEEQSGIQYGTQRFAMNWIPENVQVLITQPPQLKTIWASLCLHLR